MNKKKTVLFLCTGNSARSQMAEGLLRSVAGDRFAVSSAGTHPKGVHPMSVQAMDEIGIDIRRHTSQNVDEFKGVRFDYVITVCDNAKEHCPVFPGSRNLHWSFDDPAAAAASDQPAKFREARDAIRARIEQFMADDAS